MMNTKLNFLLGSIVGGMVGTAVGMLMAPTSGEETRGQLMEKSKEFKDLATIKALEKYQDAFLATKDVIENLKDKFADHEEIQEVLGEVEEGLKAE